MMTPLGRGVSPLPTGYDWHGDAPLDYSVLIVTGLSQW